MKTVQLTWDNFVAQQKTKLEDDTIYFINDKDFYVVKKLGNQPCYIQKQYTIIRGPGVGSNSVPQSLLTSGIYICQNTNAGVSVYYYDAAATSNQWYEIGSASGGSGGGGTPSIDYGVLENKLIQDGFVKKPISVNGTISNKRLTLSIG